MSFLLRSTCFLFLVSSFLNTFVSATQHLCHPDQRDTLLEFKTEFLIQKPAFVYADWSPKTESWVNKSDCCSWDGITCDTKSGKVIGLDLSSSDLHGELKSNSSLFRLRHLRDLNLAYNNFTASPIPARFGKLMELERLNLSGSSLSGQIPNKLLQLTKLVSLDLSSSDVDSYYTSLPILLSIDESFLHLLARNLRNLRKLDMSFVNISSEIPHEFSNMQFLRLLDLSECNLFGKFPSSVFLIPSLESIVLGGNLNLRGNLPLFGSLKHLTSLTLSISKFSGKIPFSLGNLSHLSLLDLGSNNFVGEIPSSIGNLNQLTYFHVGNNKLSGKFPATISNLTQLRSLYLSSNQFTGSLPSNISQLSKLETLFVGLNSFTGDILSSLLKIPSLKYIFLDYNQPNDLLGIENISLLPNLTHIFIFHKSYNKLGRVDLNVFSPLKQLQSLQLSGIPLSIANITSDFSSNLVDLQLRGCNITEFPEFIRNGRNLQILDLSNNKIKGQVPDWLWRLPELLHVDLSNNSLSGFNESFNSSPKSKLKNVDLSSNAFQGRPLFIPSRSLEYFSSSKNNFTGEIPRSVCGLSSLKVLNLLGNNLHGSIPWCLETLMSSLTQGRSY